MASAGSARRRLRAGFFAGVTAALMVQLPAQAAPPPGQDCFSDEDFPTEVKILGFWAGKTLSEGVLFSFSSDACGFPDLGELARAVLVRSIESCPMAPAQRAAARTIYAQSLKCAALWMRVARSKLCSDEHREAVLKTPGDDTERAIARHLAELRRQMIEAPDCSYWSDMPPLPAD